jgi:hypothetical protein
VAVVDGFPRASKIVLGTRRVDAWLMVAAVVQQHVLVAVASEIARQVVLDILDELGAVTGNDDLRLPKAIVGAEPYVLGKPFSGLDFPLFSGHVLVLG